MNLNYGLRIIGLWSLTYLVCHHYFTDGQCSLTLIREAKAKASACLLVRVSIRMVQKTAITGHGSKALLKTHSQHIRNVGHLQLQIRHGQS